jgi:single-strand DNA-binding protein
VNKVILIGNIARDPEVRYTTGSTQLAVTRFTVAISRPPKKDGEKVTDFINCVAFGSTGENIGKFFVKGDKIGVCGRIQVSTYTKDDEKRTSTDIVVESFDFCNGSKKTESTPQSEPAGVEYSEEAGEDLPF